jgi:hypothetical protein
MKRSRFLLGKRKRPKKTGASGQGPLERDYMFYTPSGKDFYS